MFELPRMVLQRGRIVFEEGELRASDGGVLLHSAPTYDPDSVDHIRNWFEQYYTIQFRNYPIDDNYLDDHEVVSTR